MDFSLDYLIDLSKTCSSTMHRLWQTSRGWAEQSFAQLGLRKFIWLGCVHYKNLLFWVVEGDSKEVKFLMGDSIAIWIQVRKALKNCRIKDFVPSRVYPPTFPLLWTPFWEYIHEQRTHPPITYLGFFAIKLWLFIINKKR